MMVPGIVPLAAERAPSIVIFQSSLPANFNRALIAALGEHEIGHAALAALKPNVSAIVEDGAVVRAVARLLGVGAAPDGCQHLHLNGCSEDGPWHQDDYCGKPWPRPMAILCYFPQDTPPEMGPTESRWQGQHLLAAGPAGTCLLMRHDVEHRATANRTGRQRYMLKFLFASGGRPGAASIGAQPAAPPPADNHHGRNAPWGWP